MKRLLTAVALAATALGANAQLTFSGGNNITFNNYNPTGVTNPQTQGRMGALITAPTAGTLTATFLGFEAIDNDTFTFNMGAFGTLSNKGPLNTSISGGIAAGNLNFTFTDLFTGTTVTNGSMGNTFGSYVILGTFNQAGTFTPYQLAGYDLVLGFNDGLPVDADYDDMVVGLRLSAIPEPETYALMLAGLGAIGFIARRRRQG